MKYYLDTEFIEDGKTIDLISIGIVCEDGRELYYVNRDCHLHLASDWVYKNVMPHLPRYGVKHDSVYSHLEIWQKHKSIRDLVKNFVLGYSPAANIVGDIEFYGYYSDYDWVVFCQLFGTMMELPKQFPMFCFDLKQLSVQLGNPVHPKQNGVYHNAIEDARWNKDLHEYLNTLQK